MPDPHAAVKATLEAASTLRRQARETHYFVNSIRNAPNAVSQLGYELDALHDTLGQLESLTTDPRRALFVIPLQRSLDKSTQILGDLDRILNTYTEKDRDQPRKWKRFAWTFKDKEIALIQTRMQSCNQALELAISIGRM